MQLDEADRGFAYSYEAPLDMRMDATQGKTAADIVNSYSEQDLARIFKEFGEERYAKGVAKAIVEARKTKPFTTSTELAGLIAKVIPFIPGKSSGHPAKRVFQALRIEVNGELEVLERTMPASIRSLAVGGRIVVLSYHSLEDRIVKQALVAAANSSAPLELPFELPEHAPVLRHEVVADVGGLGGGRDVAAGDVQAGGRAADVAVLDLDLHALADFVQQGVVASPHPAIA